jgi:hypothetical protein
LTLVTPVDPLPQVVYKVVTGAWTSRSLAPTT